MNSKEIFSVALGIAKPWLIEEVSLVGEGALKTLEIRMGFERGHKFIDPLSSAPCSVHDTLERKWRHQNFFEHPCYITCHVPRIRTPDGKVKQVAVPWAREGSGFTLMFEAYSMLLIESEMPVNKAAKVLKEYPKRLWTIFDYWIAIAYDEADHSGITKLGIDETSAKKNHKYVTLAADMDKRSVVHVTDGKGAETITAIKEHLQAKGSPSEGIEQVCIDLSPAFISGVGKEFPSAKITFDRFHVKKLLNKAMDEVRLKERRMHQALKGHKYTFLKGDKRLSPKRRAERETLLELFPVLGEAYRFKELFDDFWEMRDRAEAAAFLQYWCDRVRDAGIFPFIAFANTVQAHWSGIINYISSRINNGVLEGINSKIQLAKRRARGFRNTRNFINMIYFTCGKLKFSYPQYST
jgi:transposase